MNKTNPMFNSDLTPMFDGSVLMNETAKQDQAVIAALTKAAEDNFEFHGTWGDRYTVDEWRTSYDDLHDGALGDFPSDCF